MEAAAGKPAELIASTLEWIYDNATSGAIDLAESYRLKWAGDCERSSGDLIGSHTLRRSGWLRHRLWRHFRHAGHRSTEHQLRRHYPGQDDRGDCSSARLRFD